MTYEEKRQARIDRYRDRAERRQAEANATHQQASQMASAIPFGQPILVGHHSEKRDRNYRARIHKKFGKSFELQDQAKYREQRANAAESSTAISSDDPNAVDKLAEKLAELEADQETMKAVNAAWRKAGKPSPDDVDAWQKVQEAVGLTDQQTHKIRIDFANSIRWIAAKVPFPPYALQNNSANIRRVRQRVEQLKTAADAQHVEIEHENCRYVENVEENRVQLVFAGKPPQEIRELLKRHGFRWSPMNGAWQRQLNNSGRFAAQCVVKAIHPELNP